MPSLHPFRRKSRSRKRNVAGRLARLRQTQNVHNIIPSFITILALCLGLSAFQFALKERWDLAIFTILAAGVLDNIDGRLARRLGATTSMGAELDSLCDFASFGIMPPFIVYFWSLRQVPDFSWIFVLFFSVCSVLRLARFNTMAREPKYPWSGNFFMGIPAPVGAALSLAPMTATLAEIGDFRSPMLNGLLLIGVGLVMISRIPTYSFKNVTVGRQSAPIILLMASLLMYGIVIRPWKTLLIMGGMYLLTVPFSCLSYYRLVKKSANP